VLESTALQHFDEIDESERREQRQTAIHFRRSTVTRAPAHVRETRKAALRLHVFEDLVIEEVFLCLQMHGTIDVEVNGVPKESGSR
jgi:hypothetical protein